MSNNKRIRLDDPSVPTASTLIGLLLYGMQGGQAVKVLPTLLKGMDGEDGVDGASAYEVAKANGFVGTQAQWLDSLIGNSAYEEWVANGGVGTFQDFLDEIVETVNLLIPQTLTEAQKEQVRENINVLSQSVVTDELAKKAEHGYESSPKTLKEIDDSVSQLAGDVKETTEKPTAQSLSELNARITALEAILSNKIKDRIDVTKEFNVWGKTNLILTGSGAATFAPDFVGQKYIDTTGGNVYVAVGVSNAGNWKLV